MDQKFCIIIKRRILFDLTIGAINLITKNMILIKIHYNNLLIQCRYCLLIAHLVKESKIFFGLKRNKKLEVALIIQIRRDTTSTPIPIEVTNRPH